MIAAFLRTVDGDFDYGAAVGCVICVVGGCLYLLVVWAALKTGRTFALTSEDSPDITIQRERHPFWFWFHVVVYFLMVPLCAFGVYALCSGLWHKPD